MTVYTLALGLSPLAALVTMWAINFSRERNLIERRISQHA